MPRTYVDNAMNRSLGRVGMSLGSAVHSRSSGDSAGSYGSSNSFASAASSPRAFVDSSMARSLAGPCGGLTVGTAVHSRGASSPSPSSASSSSTRTYVDNPMNRKLDRVGLPAGSAVHSKGGSSPSPGSASSSSTRTYVDNPMNRKLDRVGLPAGSAVHSKGGSSPSPGSASSSSTRTYVDNPMNRKLDRVGLPAGSAVHSKGGSSPSPGSASASPKTYVDNPMNRKMGRVGLPVGSAVHSKGAPSPSPSPSSFRTYKDNPLNRKLNRVGLPLGSAIYRKGALQLQPDQANQLEKKVYKDNSFNRKHNRVGLPLGSKPVRKSDLCYEDNALNRRLDRVGQPLGSQNLKNKKPLAALRDWLINTDICNEEEPYSGGDSGFEELSLSGACCDSNNQASIERFDNDFDHVLENINRGQEEDLWMELESKPVRSSSSSSSSLRDPLTSLQGSIIKFEDLELKQKIGHGGFGDVYFAVYFKVVVAVKILKQGNVSKKRLEMFEREIINHSHLNHPSIVKFYGPCLERPNLAIVMEYMEASLWESIHINEADILPSHKLQIMQSITSGLAYLHSFPLIHGDLKTQNVLLLNVPGSREYDCNQPLIAKLSDFGLSLLKSDMETSQSVKMAPEGATLRYSAPEVLRGEQLSTGDRLKTDIYSMGLLIMEMAVEEIPFENLTVTQLYHQVGNLGTKPAPSLDLMLDGHLEGILYKCWDYNAKNRPSALDLEKMVSTVDRIWVEEE